MPEGYLHLTCEQRCQIYALLQSGHSQAHIARQIGVDPSTISRELVRNTGARGYRFKQAHEKASQRREEASDKPRKMTPDLVELIEEKLTQEQWSPDQISGRLAKDGVALSVTSASISMSGKGRGAPDSTLCAASRLPGRGFCTPCPAPGWRGTHALPRAHARGRASREAASSTIRADSRSPSPCGRPHQPAMPCSIVMEGSRPGRGRSSSTASGPSATARSTQRCTVW